MPPIVLTTLKWLFLALLYLFIARAIRVIYLDLVGPRAPKNKEAARRKRGRGTPKIVAIHEPGQQPRTLPLGDEIVVGRGEGCRVILEHDTYVSQLHARFYPKGGTWFIEDLGSTNGTYLNRMKVTAPQPIAVGDEVRIGKTAFQVRK